MRVCTFSRAEAACSSRSASSPGLRNRPLRAHRRRFPDGPHGPLRRLRPLPAGEVGGGAAGVGTGTNPGAPNPLSPLPPLRRYRTGSRTQKKFARDPVLSLSPLRRGPCGRCRRCCREAICRFGVAVAVAAGRQFAGSVSLGVSHAAPLTTKKGLFAFRGA